MNTVNVEIRVCAYGDGLDVEEVKSACPWFRPASVEVRGIARGTSRGGRVARTTTALVLPALPGRDDLFSSIPGHVGGVLDLIGGGGVVFDGPTRARFGIEDIYLDIVLLDATDVVEEYRSSNAVVGLGVDLLRRCVDAGVGVWVTPLLG